MELNSMILNSMEFHGLFHGIFHGIFRKIFHGNPWNSMEFHGTFHEFTERFSPGKKTGEKVAIIV
jgi:hypothetical protein